MVGMNPAESSDLGLELVYPGHNLLLKKAIVARAHQAQENREAVLFHCN